MTFATTIKNTHRSNNFMYELILYPFRCPVNYEFRGQQWHHLQPNLSQWLHQLVYSKTIYTIDGHLHFNLIPNTFSNNQKYTICCTRVSFVVNFKCYIWSDVSESCDSSRRNIIVDRQHFMDKILNTDLALSNIMPY